MIGKEKQNGKTATEIFVEQIKTIVEGLYYISETDAEILPFVGGKAKAVSPEVLLRQTKTPQNSSVKEEDFKGFFFRLTEIQDWFGEEEKEAARKFADLSDLLQRELTDLEVFKIGNVELDVYVVGLNSEGILMGIQTKAVET